MKNKTIFFNKCLSTGCLAAHLAKDLVGIHLSDCCHCQEVKIRVNAWAVCQERKGSHCRDVAIGGGSTVIKFIVMKINLQERKA